MTSGNGSGGFAQLRRTNATSITVRDIALVPPPNMYWVTRLLEYTLSPPQEYALAFSDFAGPIAIHLNLLKTI